MEFIHRLGLLAKWLGHAGLVLAIMIGAGFPDVFPGIFAACIYALPCYAVAFVLGAFKRSPGVSDSQWHQAEVLPKDQAAWRQKDPWLEN